MTDQEANTIIQACACFWPTVPLQAEYGPGMLRLWRLALADVTVAEAEAMLVHYSREGHKFPPPPGELARLVLDERARQNGTAAPDVDEAWAWVTGQVAARGWYQGPPTTWPHPAVEAAVRSLGWNRLCHDEEMIAHAHFKAMYAAASRRTESARRMGETLDMLGGPAALGQPRNTPELEWPL